MDFVLVSPLDKNFQEDHLNSARFPVFHSCIIVHTLQANSAFHPSGASKWGLRLGRQRQVWPILFMDKWVASKTVGSTDNACHTWVLLWSQRGAISSVLYHYLYLYIKVAHVCNNTASLYKRQMNLLSTRSINIEVAVLKKRTIIVNENCKQWNCPIHHSDCLIRQQIQLRSHTSLRVA